jgi:single-strand DNA-binding protein
MANFNKVILVGRLTRDPEARTFSNGGKVCKIGFAVTNRRKNSQSGQWEDEPMFIDVEVYNRGEFGKLADLVEERCRRGSQIMIEGRLHLDQWDDKTTGQKRSKHKIVVDNIQLLDPRSGDGGMSHGGGGDEEMSAPPARNNYGNRGSAPPRNAAPAPAHDDMETSGDGGDIPF